MEVRLRRELHENVEQFIQQEMLLQYTVFYLNTVYYELLSGSMFL